MTKTEGVTAKGLAKELLGENLPTERWEVSKLVPYELNAKKHPPEQVTKLANSIRAFGWGALIHVDKDGVVIIGHGRRLAAIELGLTHVMVHCRRDLSVGECHALRIADNRVVSTEYDQAKMQESILALDQTGFDDMGLTGMSERELDAMLSDKAFVMPDSFVDDVSVAVEAQKAENEAKVEEIEKGDVPVSEAFGFKRVTVKESRRVKALVALMEEETGKRGIAAILAYADEVGA